MKKRNYPPMKLSKRHRIVKWYNGLSHAGRDGILVSIFVLAIAIIGTGATLFTRAAYAYTTLYRPNKNADATLLVCRDTGTDNRQILRVKYIGNDSPFIKMKTVFGPQKKANYTQALTKYKQNWTWQGSYPIPVGASSIKVIFTFDDYTTDSGGSSLSTIVKCVADNKLTPTAPSVSISTLANGATVSKTVSIIANASDTQGIRNVQFKVDGKNLGYPVTASPYKIDWDTTAAGNGSHNITAVATNTTGLTTTSSVVKVTVNNTTSTAPSAPTSGNSTIKAVTPGTAWDLILTGNPTTAHIEAKPNLRKLIEIDLEDNSATTISSYKQKGITVICYFSAGSYENWRSDAGKFPASAVGKSNGWAGENWLDIRDSSVLAIMETRMDVAVSKGCDGVDPDNVDGYTNNTGFPLTANDQLTYNTNLAARAHARKLAIGLKNDNDQIPSLVGSYDFAVNEQCNQYNECGPYSAFIKANKAVFNAEYNSSNLNCAAMNAANIDSVLFSINLDGSQYQACR